MLIPSIFYFTTYDTCYPYSSVWRLGKRANNLQKSSFSVSTYEMMEKKCIFAAK